VSSAASLAPIDLHGKWLRRARPFVFLFCGVAFVLDILHSDTLAVGIAYIPMVCMALLNRSRAWVWWLTAIGIVLIVVGTFLPEINPNLLDLIGNRLLSVIAVLLTGTLVSYAQKIQERLAEQTRRAEEAERLKTEILACVGRDLRSPLHAIIGLAEVMGASCEPGQRDSLGQVQTASRELLTSIDELVDLIESDEAHSQPSDLRTLVHRVQPTGANIRATAQHA
jgi:signal transduction histidine kinase